MMDIKRFKRVLVINDDDTEEQFFMKNENLQKHQDMISYCNTPMQAFELITSDNFGGFDKIVLDIKLEWEIPKTYEAKLNEHVAMNAITNANIGFLIFMYLVSRGYPIDRIAFLSAYIMETDDELKEKERILEVVRGWKKRDAGQDEWLIQNADIVPSLKGRIIRTLKNNSYKGIKAYEEIKKILIQDIAPLHGSQTNTNGEVETNEAFFQLIAQTGLIVKNKINKKDKGKLEAWIGNEKTDGLREYYAFRNMVLNICEHAQTESPDIYNCYRSNKFKTSYPDKYFEDLMKKVQYEISALKENEDIERITKNVVSILVSFWESLDKKYITDTVPAIEDINIHALTMLLKNTRNWYAHGRLKKIGIAFCRFVFLSSVRVIYGDSKILEDYIERELGLKNAVIHANEAFYKKIWKDINDKIIATKSCKANAYIINLPDLYNKYSHDEARGDIHLTIFDLYGMFILCLHFPNVVISNTGEGFFRIVFNEIDYTKQERYMLFLEKIAMINLERQQNFTK
ncbi:MAG: hypothetical protein K2N73_03125 [Lachnospiraceae bacterium]|nr:hypothetical protein [Lachnospiraceae bacterium]